VTTSITSATIAASSIAGWGVVLGAGGAVLVIGLLIAMELLGASDRPRGMLLQRLLRVATVPLVTVFAVSILTKAVIILSQP
jgi:hypothetical protein